MERAACVPWRSGSPAREWLAPEPEEPAALHLGPAQGIVTIPDETRVHVSIDPGRLPRLEPLAPDGLAALYLNKTAATDRDLAFVRPFTGLRVLDTFAQRVEEH